MQLNNHVYNQLSLFFFREETGTPATRPGELSNLILRNYQKMKLLQAKLTKRQILLIGLLNHQGYKIDS